MPLAIRREAPEPEEDTDRIRIGVGPRMVVVAEAVRRCECEEVVDGVSKIVALLAQDLEDDAGREPRGDPRSPEHPLAVHLPAFLERRIG